VTPDELERFLASLTREHDGKEGDAVTPVLLRPRPEGVKATPREASAVVPPRAPLVGLTEAAVRLDCHRRTIRAYIRAGLLTGLFLAGRWKIRREDLEAFIEAAARARNGLKPRT
jgi:excisionase family DNA binding protein